MDSQQRSDCGCAPAWKNLVGLSTDLVRSNALQSLHNMKLLATSASENLSLGSTCCRQNYLFQVYTHNEQLAKRTIKRLGRYRVSDFTP